MAHPDIEQAVPLRIRPVLDIAQEGSMPMRAHLGVPEFAHASRFHPAAELRCHRLHTVANAEHGYAEGPHDIGSAWRLLLDDAFGTAGEHDALRREAANERLVDVERMDFAVVVHFSGQKAVDSSRSQSIRCRPLPTRFRTPTSPSDSTSLLPIYF